MSVLEKIEEKERWWNDQENIVFGTKARRTRKKEERMKVEDGRGTRGEDEETEEGSARQLVASGVPPHGKLVAKSGPVASVLSDCVWVFVCMSGIWLHLS